MNKTVVSGESGCGRRELAAELTADWHTGKESPVIARGI